MSYFCVFKWSLLGVKICLSHTQMVSFRGLNSNFPTSIPVCSRWESPLRGDCISRCHLIELICSLTRRQESSGIPQTLTLRKSALKIPVFSNEWFASNRIPRYAQRTLGSPGGKHCYSLEGNVWRKAVSTSKKRHFGGRSTLFRRIFIADGLRECWNAENVSFCQYNREICDKIYR